MALIDGKGVLVVIDRAPYGNWQGREALDMSFSLAAFDRPVCLMFTGAGVNWLRSAQAAESIGQKTVSRNLSAARIFGVETLYADEASLQAYGLTGDNAPEAEAQSLTAAFTRSFDHVVLL